MIAETVLQTLQKDCYYDPHTPVLVGVSGGPDSLALLHILHQAGIKLIVAHLDHGLRSNSPADAVKVKEVSETWGLECVVDRVDVNEFASVNKKSLEEAARECRYQFLFDQAMVHHAQAVVVAHTADDQVETILMHLLRGAGMSGLSGMHIFERNPHWNPAISLYRPMLGVWRDEIVAYCESNALTPIFDESNSEEIYLRNRIRHSLIPNLESYNPQIKQVLFKMADVVREDNQLLSQIAEEIWLICLKQQSVDCLTVQRGPFEAQPVNLQRRMLRLGIKNLRPDLRDIGFDNIGRAVEAITSTRTDVFRLNLGTGLDLLVEADVFHILEAGQDAPFGDLPQLFHSKTQVLNPGETLALQNDWELSVRLVKVEDMKCLSRSLLEDALQAWISPDTIEFPLYVQGKLQGDRWCPLGLGGHSQKLSDFFINEKVPTGARLKWPLVVSGEEIIWVAGFRPSEKTALTGEETTVLNLSLKKHA
ncbi:MAG: tRNA lysidine(34) synthetase TilS [Anaerolineaceae bacterium]|nr:tRNA lysidine(34) synthetase TilS [Anaerolineaceae bacterium]